VRLTVTPPRAVRPWARSANTHRTAPSPVGAQASFATRQEPKRERSARWAIARAPARPIRWDTGLRLAALVITGAVGEVAVAVGDAGVAMGEAGVAGAPAADSGDAGPAMAADDEPAAGGAVATGVAAGSSRRRTLIEKSPPPSTVPCVKPTGRSWRP
jgi:hypothetical protein